MLGFGELLKQAKQLQEFIQNELDSIEVESEAGAGQVKVRMNGKKIPILISIMPELLNEDRGPQLEALLLSALQDAVRKVEQEVQRRVGDMLPPGLQLPGF